MTTAFQPLLIAGLVGAVIGLLWVADRQGLYASDSPECRPPVSEAPPPDDGGVRRAA